MHFYDLSIKISIIVPIYNTERYLNECIDSILRQTYSDYELILVDDGSTDGSLEIAKEYENRNGRVKVISCPHRGRVFAREEGVRQARGKYIGFVDSDDWIDPQMYEEMLNAMTGYNCDFASYGIYHNYLDGRTEIHHDNYQEGVYTNLEEDIYPSMLWNFKENDFGIYHNLVTKLFKREILINVLKEIDNSIFFGEDALICMKYIMSSSKIFVSHKPVYHYRKHSDSTCFTYNPRLVENAWLLYISFRDLFESNHNKDELMPQLQRYIWLIEESKNRILYGINPAVYGDWKFQCDEYLDNKIVLYGGGVCGRAFYLNALQNGKSSNIVAWIDAEGDQKSRECCHKILEPSIISRLEYDYIVIAIVDEKVMREIKDELIEEYHVPNERIISENGR